MPTPSRLMPKAKKEKANLFDQLVFSLIFAVLIGWVAYLFWNYPLASIVVALLGMFSIWTDTRRHRRRLKALAASRPPASICTFARSFNRHAVDTWVIRAVYEELQRNIDYPDAGFPLRAEDDLVEGLGLDEDDLELNIIESIAQRTGRTLTNAKSNPLCGRIWTAQDLVLFFNAQPRAS